MIQKTNQNKQHHKDQSTIETCPGHFLFNYKQRPREGNKKKDKKTFGVDEDSTKTENTIPLVTYAGGSIMC